MTGHLLPRRGHSCPRRGIHPSSACCRFVALSCTRCSGRVDGVTDGVIDARFAQLIDNAGHFQQGVGARVDTRQRQVYVVTLGVMEEIAKRPGTGIVDEENLLEIDDHRVRQVSLGARLDQQCFSGLS